ncbi:NUDIX hydrolase [Fulvitalea axinellae]
MDWKTLKSERVLEDRWISVRSDVCQMPNGRLVEPYYVLDYPDWVAVVAITDEGEVIINRQYRHGAGRTILELPSGTVEPNEDPAETVARELLEETGYIFDKIIKTGETSANPSNHSNIAHCFLALGGRKIAEQNLDESEEIEVNLVSLDRFGEMLEGNELLQAMHVTSAFYALRKLDKMKGPDLG